jgi:hypothetical protein
MERGRSSTQLWEEVNDMPKYQVFRKYVFEADDPKAARKIWMGAAANDQEEDMLEFEGMPKEVEEKGSWASTAKRQITGK